MSELPAVRSGPPDRLWQAEKSEMVEVTDWDGNIDGGLAIGNETMDEWLKIEGLNPVDVLDNV